MSTAYTRERLERVCRLYRTAQDAARALGLTTSAFYRLCKQHGLATPAQRRRQAQRKEIP